jgi:hypothetical protein
MAQFEEENLRLKERGTELSLDKMRLQDVPSQIEEAVAARTDGRSADTQRWSE